MEWNKGKRTGKTPSKVSQAIYSSYKEKRAKLCEFDPRPSTHRQADKQHLNKFVSSLKYSSIRRGGQSMWQTLLTFKYDEYIPTDDRISVLKIQSDYFHRNLKEDCVKFDSDIFMIPQTELQSDSAEWKSNRWFRITASTAKQANNLGALLKNPSSDNTLIKLQNFISQSVWNLHPFSSSDMTFGIDNEDKARDEYKTHMLTLTPGFNVKKTGFWVNNQRPELGCSPDGLVTDPTESEKHGLLEIKCLKVFRSYAPSDLYKNLETNVIKRTDLYNACFGIPTCDNVRLELKTNHYYYFQIQYQMAITGLAWCDFVLWSPLGLPNIERIRRDDQLISSMTANVTTLWRKVIAPELFEMRVPRNLKPIILT